MRKLVIILAVFVLLFVAVLVWGVARDRDEPTLENPADQNCNGPPKRAKKDKHGLPVFDENRQPVEEVDTDKLGDWVEHCGPTGGKRTANRFTPGTVLEPSTIKLAGQGAIESRNLGSIKDEDKIRVVKLAKVSGGAIEVTAAIEGEEDPQQLCLCEPGDRLTDKDNKNRICGIAIKSNSCPEDNKSGVFAVGKDGAEFTFKSVVRSEAKSSKR